MSISEQSLSCVLRGRVSAELPLEALIHGAPRNHSISLLVIVSALKCCIFPIDVGALSTLGGTTFLPEKYVWKINKKSEVYMILARKVIKIPEFLCYLPEKLTKFSNLPDFARKIPDFYIKIARKNFPRFFFFWGGGRHVPYPSAFRPVRLCSYHTCVRVCLCASQPAKHR